DCLVNSPHGPIQLSDGRVLYAGKELWSAKERNGICVSSDDGKSWKWLAEVPTRPGDTAAEYHELHAVETTKGTLVVHLRNHNKAKGGQTLQKGSSGGGQAGSGPDGVGVGGRPAPLAGSGGGAFVDSVGPPPQAVRQPGASQRGPRPHLVGVVDDLRRRPRRRPWLSLDGTAGRRLAADGLVRGDAGAARPSRPPSGPLAARLRDHGPKETMAGPLWPSLSVLVLLKYLEPLLGHRAEREIDANR